MARTAGQSSLTKIITFLAKAGGFFEKTISNGERAYYERHANKAQYWVLRATPNLNVKWERRLTGGSSSARRGSARGIIESPDLGIVAVGSVHELSWQGRYWAEMTLNDSGPFKLLTTKSDRNGRMN